MGSGSLRRQSGKGGCGCLPEVGQRLRVSEARLRDQDYQSDGRG